MPWPQVHFFWTDERPVHADHPDSNYAMARAAMLEKLALTKKQIHRIRTEGLNPAQAAHEHQRELTEFFTQHLMMRYNLPRLDMVLLGMGADGHVAGLFPNTPSLRERRLFVTAPKPVGSAQQRITLTLALFNNAANVAILVSGKEKAEAVKASLEGPPDPDRWPAQAIKPSEGRVVWLLDRAAASLLSP
jgi:6-phosphogluconolactonase